jgi:tetratricopeptide (TPR) repeat protein
VAELSGDALEAMTSLPDELRSLAAYEALLERSWVARREQPRQMVRLAELAVMAAAGLGGEGFSSGQVHDFQARAAAELANAYRVVERHQEALASLDAARHHFLLGSQEKLLGARILEVEASIRGDHDDYDTAFAALDGALRIYRRHGDAHLVGRCLIKKGMYTAHSGRQREAIELLNAGLEMVDAEQDPPLALSAVHNTAYCLAETGRYREARSLLWRHQALYAQHAGGQILLRLSWLQAQIYTNLNDLERAEKALEEARRGFHAAGKPHSEAFTLAELAGLQLRRGREEEARLLALEAAAVFIRLDKDSAAASAMVPVQAQLTRRQAPTPQLVQEVMRLLRDTAPADQASLFARSA